nr:DUF4238 domain-containing protein [Synechococcus elongatus PCC 11802]
MWEKNHLNVQEIEDNRVIRTFQPNITKFLVDRGIYDISEYRAYSSNFADINDGFLEDIVFAKVHESIYDKSLRKSVDLNLVPSLGICKGIIQGIWTLYLRTPRIRRINSLIISEVDSEINDHRRMFMKNFGMVTAKTILKLFPKVFVQTRSILFNAVGTSRFLTTDHPSIPCLFNEQYQITRCDEHELQSWVILADHWPQEVALLCALSPRWCILTQSISDISSVECQSIGSEKTELINHFIRQSADKFIILPPSK